jgi:hypothetical protein
VIHLSSTPLELTASGGTLTLDLIETYLKLNDIVYPNGSESPPRKFIDYWEEMAAWIQSKTGIALSTSEVYHLVMILNQQWTDAKKNYGQPSESDTTST